MPSGSPPLNNPSQQKILEPPSLRVETLQGFHLPLLTDPAFVPLQPQIQRALLLGLPERWLQRISHAPCLAPAVLVASLERQHPLALIISRRLNRSGSCWQVDHLRLASSPSAATISRAELATALLREAIQRGRGAASWIARACSQDSERLAVLRQQGFQPVRTDTLWRWCPSQQDNRNHPLPSELQWRPLNRSSAPLLWHLEQAACSAHLRQLLDRRSEDLLDQSGNQGWMLVDQARSQAVAGIRKLRLHPQGGLELELTVHPLWSQLVGEPCEALLRRLAPAAQTIWLRCEDNDTRRHQWLASIGAEIHGEQMLMARSVWRRQDPQPTQQAARRIEAVLAQLQPGRRSLPTPWLHPPATAGGQQPLPR
ncbi:MAG: hypothetical protein R6W06_01275 [Prochlorococcaceae cyanobacterium]